MAELAGNNKFVFHKTGLTDATVTGTNPTVSKGSGALFSVKPVMHTNEHEITADVGGVKRRVRFTYCEGRSSVPELSHPRQFPGNGNSRIVDDLVKPAISTSYFNPNVAASIEYAQPVHIEEVRRLSGRES